MKSKNKFVLVVAVVLVGAGTAVFLGFKSWRNGVIARQEQHDFAETQKLIVQNDFQDALTIIQQQSAVTAKLNWPPLEVRALAGLLAAPQLAAIYQRTPQRILADEEASLVLERAFLASRNNPAFTAIRSVWAGHETQQVGWLVLDSDACLEAGKPRAAEKVLRSQQFTGKAEAARLERLSLLVAGRDLPQAWELLSSAVELDSHNPELRSFRGQMLEAAGKPAAARLEYLAAVIAETNNPLLTDQLAEFYRRQNDYDAALATWEAALTRPGYDFIALKTAFWQRLIRPGNLDAGKIPDGELAPLAKWIAGLDATEFFDTNSFNDLPAAQQLAQQRQEIFWLRLADALQQKRETEAAGLLQFNPLRARSWQPDLEVALARIIHYRQKNSLNPPEIAEVTDAPADRHEFFVQLEALAAQERTDGRAAVPADLDALLRGPDAFAAAFMAAGWREAALRLCDPEKVSTNEPTWFAYGLAQVLRMNRGDAAALKFLSKQNTDAPLQLLTAEIKIETGDQAAGLADLTALAPQNSAVGFRASYILALANVDAKKFDEAKKWVLQNAPLASDLLGRELLANIAVQTGQMAEAGKIYSAIAGESIPARAFLAKQAFDRRDWPEARRLTSELVQVAPEDLRFRANLAMIDKKLSGE
jgi:predicted Zn-dependent protease